MTWDLPPARRPRHDMGLGPGRVHNVEGAQDHEEVEDEELEPHEDEHPVTAVYTPVVDTALFTSRHVAVAIRRFACPEGSRQRRARQAPEAVKPSAHNTQSQSVW